MAATEANQQSIEIPPMEYDQETHETSLTSQIDGLPHIVTEVSTASREEKTSDRFRCTECGKKFIDRYELRRHGVVHTKEQPFRCEKCFRFFTQKASLVNHMLIHNRIKKFQCTHCPMKFIQKIHLDTHVRHVHPPADDPDLEKYFHCQKCPSAYKRIGRLQNHRARVHGEMVMLDRWLKPALSTAQTTYSGNKSDDGESSANFLSDERTTIDNDNDIVHKVIKSRRTEHLTGKTPDRPHACTTCPAAFKKAHHLSQHMTSHRGIRPYRCDICDKTFSSKQSCNTHAKLHSQTVRQFSCDKCEETFNRLATLKRHALVHEELSYSFRCPYCNKNFRWLQNCRAHLKAFHVKEASNGEALLQPIKENVPAKSMDPT